MDKITVVCHKDHDKGYEDLASEQEAYAIQQLSQTLMEEFERRMK